MTQPAWRRIGPFVKRGLAGVNYLLTLAVSVVVIVIAVVLMLALVNSPSVETAPTTLAPGPTTAAPVTSTTSRTGTTAPADCTVPDPPSPGADTTVVRVFFSCVSDPAPTGRTWVYRLVPNDGLTLLWSLQQLTAGPTDAERREGFTSLFTEATADAVIGATVDKGEATVDLRDLGPMPSLATGDDAPKFLADLNNTVFDHPEVDSVRYLREGDCNDFWAYFGVDQCRTITRAQWAKNSGASPDV